MLRRCTRAPVDLQPRLADLALTAHLSDASAADYTNVQKAMNGSQWFVYTFTYQAAYTTPFCP